MRVALVLKAVKWLGVGLLLAVFAVLSLPDADVPSPWHLIFLFALLGVWLAWIPFSLRNLSWRRGFLVLAAITLVAPVVVFSHMLFDLTNVSFPPPTTAEDAIELVKKHRLEGRDLAVGEAVERSARDGTQPQWEASRVDPDNDTVPRWWVKVGDYQFTITFLGGVREGFFGG